MKNLIGALVLVVSSFLAAGVASGDSAQSLPTRLGKHVFLGMPVDQFNSVIGIQPTRCASCTHGELMTELPSALAVEAVNELPAFDLAATKDLAVECYFEAGHLQTIVARGLSGREPLSRLKKQFGHGHTLQAEKELRETEWVVGQRRLRLSEHDGAFDVILSRNH